MEMGSLNFIAAKVQLILAGKKTNILREDLSRCKTIIATSGSKKEHSMSNTLLSRAHFSELVNFKLNLM